jgi:hypothetical protein
MRMEVNMTKVLKRVTAAVMALIMMVSAAGCSGDKTWAAKKDNDTVPIGVYIFYLYSAYGEASSKVTDTSKAVLSQKIDNKDAATWIRDTAMTSLKSYLAVDAKMKELKLELTADEKKTASSNSAQAWSSYGTTFQNYGISQASFELAYSQYNAKRDKIFLALYGKNGKNAVSDDELKTYFEKNFTDFNYINAPFTTADASGNAVALTDAQKTALKKEFDDYAASINSGKMTITEAAAAYKTSSKATSDPLQSYTTVLSKDDLATDFGKLITNAKPGAAQVSEISSNYVLLVKNDITKKSATQISTDNGRNTVLYEMKSTEFADLIKTEAGKLSGATFNDAAINDQKLEKFVTAVSSAPAATASTAATASAAATSSTATSSK